MSWSIASRSCCKRSRLSRPAALLAVLLIACTLPSEVAAKEPAAPFLSWSDAAFAQAKRERRILVVMVSTSWCHWCHVMKRETYGDPGVLALLKQSFLPIYVDADARPDLAERFRNYRWPATAFLTPDAQPILALRGYRSPRDFLSTLRTVQGHVRRGPPYPGLKDPNEARTAPVVTDEQAALEALATQLRAQLQRTWDPNYYGWGKRQKYPLPEPIAFGLRMRALGEKQAPEVDQAEKALQAQGWLLDREWGGVYQYSVGPGWDGWHPEKIMSVNAGALANYARAGRLQEAALVRRWFRDYLTAPDGAFYTSQDADAPRLAGEKFYRLSAKARAAYGVPRVDRSIYARENGQAIQAHCAYQLASDAADGDTLDAQEAAVRAAERILRTHRNADGSFRHATSDTGRLFLVDQVEMGRALLALYSLTMEPRWMAACQQAAKATRRRFARPGGGFYDTTVSRDPGMFAKRTWSLAPNAGAATWLLDLGAVTADPSLRAEARNAILAVADPRRLRSHWRYIGGLLLAVDRARRPAIRITVSGAAGPALHLFTAYARVEARDPRVYVHRTIATGLPSMTVCTDTGVCLPPVRGQEDLRKQLADLRTQLAVRALPGTSPGR